ncbi:hypothetical protein F5Y17DRAFT_348065 [Xylariaceae sp. FL0594]|nr:hypothetical protein F5Y17DRAFT_348065 [Xylariaceae sp. FL0594]
MKTSARTFLKIFGAVPGGRIWTWCTAGFPLSRAVKPSANPRWLHRGGPKDGRRDMGGRTGFGGTSTRFQATWYRLVGVGGNLNVSRGLPQLQRCREADRIEGESALRMRRLGTGLKPDGLWETECPPSRIAQLVPRESQVCLARNRLVPWNAAIRRCEEPSPAASRNRTWILSQRVSERPSPTLTAPCAGGPHPLRRRRE